MPNLSKYFNSKNILYLIIFVFALYIGDKDLENLLSKKLNLNSNMATNINQQNNYPRIDSSPKEGEYLVTKIVDGDTVHVVDSTGHEEVLRFLAVDTLEKNSLDVREKCLANLESKFTEENLLNKKVLLEVDPTQGERDKYGRLLVYVKEVLGTKTFNEILLETGSARVYKASPPAINYKKYVELQTEAQKNNLGMWNDVLCK